MARPAEVAVLLLVYACVVSAYNRTEWKLYNYPNPVYNPEKCGAKEASFLCDPDGFLTPYEGNYATLVLKDRILHSLYMHVYSPGGVYHYYLYNERDASWVFPYPLLKNYYEFVIEYNYYYSAKKWRS